MLGQQCQVSIRNNHVRNCCFVGMIGAAYLSDELEFYGIDYFYRCKIIDVSSNSPRNSMGYECCISHGNKLEDVLEDVVRLGKDTYQG